MARKFVRRGKKDFLFDPEKKTLRNIPRASEFRGTKPSGFTIKTNEPRAKSIVSKDLEERFKKKRVRR